MPFKQPTDNTETYCAEMTFLFLPKPAPGKFNEYNNNKNKRGSKGHPGGLALQGY